jgi:hypothetical protein
MISFVNGFLCTSSCDVSKAKRGVDPHPKPDDASKPAPASLKDATATDKNTTATSSTVVTAASDAQRSAATSSDQRGQIVDLLV